MKVQRFLIYSLPPHLHNLPHYQHPYLIVVLICNSQMTYDMEHLFICLFAISISSLVSCLLGSLAHFLFLLLYLRVLYTFWILILYQICLFFERQIPYDITYTWNLKYDPNEFVYETEIDRLIDKENRLMIAKGEEGLGVRD